jgi:hypothetical protein
VEIAVQNIETRTREQEMLCCCARVTPTERQRRKAMAILEQGVDWDLLYRYARHHAVTSLVHRSLLGIVPGLAEQEGFQRLDAYAREMRMQNLLSLRQLLTVIDRLGSEGVTALPFKGPILGASVYGDVGLREFGDLDILVARNQVYRTKELLQELGYEPYRQLTPREEERHIATQMGYEFVNRQEGSVVELHWSFLNTCHNFRLGPEDVMKRAVSVTLGGREVKTFAPEDLLIYLCAHGTKHAWERLNWIADIAELSRQDLDWQVVEERARALGAWRMVCIGLHLAHDLLDAEPPEGLAEEVLDSRPVRMLAEMVTDSWLFRAPYSPRPRPNETFFFLLRSRERSSDSVPFVFHNLRLMVAPSEKDREFLPLPNEKSKLYYVVRPVRLLRDVFFGSARA